MIRIVSRPVSCLASCVVALAALVVTPGTAAASFVQYFGAFSRTGLINFTSTQRMFRRRQQRETG